MTPEPRFEDCRPLDDDDQEVLDDIRRVLERHGCLDRFGVTLLHRHFDLGPDELLVETVDETERTLTIRPQVFDAGREVGTATSWRFVEGIARPTSRLECFPVKDSRGNVINHMK